MIAGLRRRYNGADGEAFADRMAKLAMSAASLEGSLEPLVIMTRPSLIRDFVKKGVAPIAADAWCWSQWRGYLENADGAALRSWFDGAGAKADHIHTSSHASSSDLREFAMAMNPKTMVPIHGVKWDEDRHGFPPITRLKDGEPLRL